MFVLGIDPGLSRTGYAVVSVDGEGMRAIVAGVIHTAPELTVGARLAELYRDLKDVLETHDVGEAAVERLFTTRNRQTAIGVGQASGVAILVAAQAGVPVVEYTPTQVKAAVCGFGGADKEQVRRAVMQRLELDELEGPADVADAIAVALCHAQGLRMRRIEAGAAG